MYKLMGLHTLFFVFPKNLTPKHEKSVRRHQGAAVIDIFIVFEL